MAPAAYGWLLYAHRSATLRYTLAALGGILGMAVVVGIFSLFAWFSNTKEAHASLAREWLSAKKKGWCPIIKAKPVSPAAQ